MIQIQEMIPMDFFSFEAIRERIPLVETDLHQTVFLRNCLKERGDVIRGELMEGENAQLLHEKGLAEVMDEVFSLARYWHDTQIFVTFNFNQRFPSRMHNVKIPRPGIYLTVEGMLNALVPPFLVDPIVFQIGNHTPYSKTFRYKSGHPTQRFWPPKVSLWVRKMKVPFTFLTSSITLVIIL